MARPTLEEARAQGISLADLKKERAGDRGQEAAARSWRQELRAEERETADAYKWGREDAEAEARERAQEPAPRAPRGARASRARRASSSRGGGGLLEQARGSRLGSSVEDGAGFVLGMLVYALVLAYLRDGPAGVKGWIRAKFINEPYTKATSTPARPAAASPPSTPSAAASGVTARESSTSGLPSPMLATTRLYTPPTPGGPG